LATGLSAGLAPATGVTLSLTSAAARLALSQDRRSGKQSTGDEHG